MSIIPFDKCIRCSFETHSNTPDVLPPNKIEVYYGINGNQTIKSKDLNNHNTLAEKLRADKFRFQEDKDTYLLCHALLRSVLSKKMGVRPVMIIFSCDKNNKPSLSDNKWHFNITHTKNAFAFVLSEFFYVGIDMENTYVNINMRLMLNTVFNESERDVILRAAHKSKEVSCLFWTRKEALLKALGTGLIDELKQINVANKENAINKHAFKNQLNESVNYEHYIYSEKIMTYYLSVAIPKKAEINMFQITEENIDTFLT